MLGTPELLVLLRKLAHLSVLTAEDLRDLHAGKVFGEIGIDVGGAVLDLTVRTTRELAEDHGEQHDKRHKTKHHQRQLEVETEHGAKHADDHKGILGKPRQQVDKQHRHGVGVVHFARDQLADRHFAELIV